VRSAPGTSGHFGLSQRFLFLVVPQIKQLGAAILADVAALAGHHLTSRYWISGLLSIFCQRWAIAIRPAESG
jgi:hypothetical protein